MTASWIAAGLYDPHATNAAERLELLHWIHEQGVSLEEMVEACRRDQLGAVVGDRLLRPGRRLTMTDVAAETGLSLAQVETVRRVGGFPDAEPTDPVYVEDDLEMFRAFKVAAELFSPEELAHFTRVIGSSLRRIAEAAGEMFLRDVEAPMQPHATELDKAKATAAGNELARSATAVFDPMFRAHLEVATRTMRRAREGLSDYTMIPLTVAFVDLNGFTTRSGEVTPEELLSLIMSFESTAIDLVSEHGGRLIKLIGDEVMFTTIAPADACHIAAEIVQHASGWATSARGGIAHGFVLTSGGDVYGEVVNLASRIADIAVSGELLVNESVVQSAPDLAFEPAGRRQLKGFSQPTRLWSLPVA
ncbi:MAG TPA: adenylate cyclase regulatory domain-containing protein [Ilumatobacteraceae bacterium]|nr:adenylate cyclase regulatory domain-containing protein [Ilumatobacteraceae bacterium]